MANEQTTAGNTLLDNIFSLANTWSTPFAKKLAGEDSESDEATAQRILDERLRNNRLNGSGPSNEVLAREAPQGILDFITGRNLAPQQATQRTGGIAIALVILGGLLIFIVLRK